MLHNLCYHILGNIEAKKAKATKKLKAVEGGKKKSKGKLKEATEKSEEKIEEAVQGSKCSSKSTVPSDKISAKQAKNDTKSPPIVKDGCKTTKEEKKNRKSHSRSSSRSFSVSKSPTPSREKFRNSRSPPQRRNESWSPAKRSPLGYRDYRSNRESYNDYRKDSYERNSLSRTPHHYEKYGNHPPRFPTSHQGNEKSSSYDCRESRHMQYERRGPTSYRKSPNDYNRGDARMRRNNSHVDDYQGDRGNSPDRNQQRPRSPIRYSRQETRRKSSSPSNRKRLSSGTRNDEQSFKNHSNNKRDIDRSSNRNNPTSRNRARNYSNSPSPHSNERKLTSSIGAVISHQSDGEYDPEKILKKSIVASKVRIKYLGNFQKARQDPCPLLN